MKLGVVLCDCNKSLSEIINYEDLEKVAKNLKEVNLVKRVSLLCKNPEEILKDFKNFDGILFGCCSEKYSLTFNEDFIVKLLKKLDIDESMFEVANLREQCAWIHQFDPEAATRKAIDMLLMAYEKLKTNQPALKFNQIEKRVLVVGAGVAGVSCALSLKKLGIEVDLVEKNPYIGGKATQVFMVWQSDSSPSFCISVCPLPHLLKKTNFEEINLYTNTVIKDVQKNNGSFLVSFIKNPLYVEPTKCTSCGKCKEVCPIEIDNPSQLGIGKRKAIDKDYPTAIPDTFYILKDVCDECKKCIEVCPSSAINLEEKPAEFTKKYGAVVLATGFTEHNFQSNSIPIDGKKIITFRQAEYFLINRFFGKPPQKVAFILPEEKNSHCAILTWAIAVKLINFLTTRMRIKTLVFYHNLPKLNKTISTFKKKAEKKGAQFIKTEVEKVFVEGDDVKIIDKEGKEYTVRLAIVSQKFLPYGKEVAEKFGIILDEEGYPVEFQPKVVNPLETTMERVFVAGGFKSCNKNIQESIESGQAVAIRVYEALQGKTQKFYSKIIPENCSKCGLCTSVCPHSAIKIKENFVEIDPAFCRGCGLCYAVCSSNAIKFINLENEQILKMAKVAFSNHNPEEGPKVLVFLCYWCSYTSADVMGYYKLDIAPNFRAIRVRCSASLDPMVIMEIIKRNYADKVIITGCPPKNCHHLWGNYITEKRFTMLKDLLKTFGFPENSVRFEYIGVSQWNKLAQIINQTCEDIEI